MKGLLVFLCVLVAAQARSSSLQSSSRSLAALGENPGLVHLRLATFTSGLLRSCAGSLIDERWVLTSANCVRDIRFIWIRYGVVTVINPELVTEASAARVNPNSNAALISINRVVQSTANISPYPLLQSGNPGGYARVCVFGATESGGPGEQLSCADSDVVALSPSTIVVEGSLRATEYDDGAPLVEDGVQVGVLIRWPQSAEDNLSAEYLSTTTLVDWIESETGLSL